MAVFIHPDTLPKYKCLQGTKSVLEISGSPVVPDDQKINRATSFR